jgi:hypothetical protein
MKKYLILSTSNGQLFLVDEFGDLQRFDLDFGLILSMANGQVQVGALMPLDPDAVVRELVLPLDQAQFNLSLDQSSEVLSIVLTPIFPSTASLGPGGKKLKFGSVDLTLSRNILSTASLNLGEAEVGSPQVPATALEWYVLDLSQFNLAMKREEDHLRLTTLKKETMVLALME